MPWIAVLKGWLQEGLYLKLHLTAMVPNCLSGTLNVEENQEVKGQ
jgi:hypothetical protein